MKNLIIFISLLFLSGNIFCGDLESAIVGFDAVANTSTDAIVNCDSFQKPPDISVDLNGDPNLYHLDVKLGRSYGDKKSDYLGDEVSVLTIEEANELFEEFSRIKYLHFKYLHDGCFSRAHELALIAKEHGIEMGKVFLSSSSDRAQLFPKNWINNPQAPVPSGFMGWHYHVVPYVLVEENGELKPFVFDVGVSPKGEFVEDWRNGLEIKSGAASLTYKDRDYMFADTSYKTGEVSTIASQIEEQRLIEELGINEFLFRKEQGWL